MAQASARGGGVRPHAHRGGDGGRGSPASALIENARLADEDAAVRAFVLSLGLAAEGGGAAPLEAAAEREILALDPEHARTPRAVFLAASTMSRARARDVCGRILSKRGKPWCAEAGRAAVVAAVFFLDAHVTAGLDARARDSVECGKLLRAAVLGGGGGGGRWFAFGRRLPRDVLERAVRAWLAPPRAMRLA